MVVATAAIIARVAGAALKVSAAQCRDAAIGLAADVLLLDIENWENRVKIMTRSAINREIPLGLYGGSKTAEGGQPQQGAREGRTEPHIVRMR